MIAGRRALVVLILAVLHVALAVGLFSLRVHDRGSVFAQDVYAFGLPFAVASLLYFVAIIKGRGDDVPSDGRILGTGLLAVLLGAVVQLIAMTVAVNIYGS